MVDFDIPVKDNFIISGPIADIRETYYDEMFPWIDTLGKEAEFNGNKGLYDQARYIIANYVQLVYERLELKFTRDINYTEVKDWASENDEVVRYLLSCQFPKFEIGAFDKWIQPDTEIIKMGMYSPSTRQNKNIYH